MVDARLIAVHEVVRSAVEQAVMSACGHQLEVAIRGLAELRLVLRKEHEGGMAAIAGAASPPAPLVVARAPRVVPCAVRQHELEMSSQCCDGLFEHRLVVGEKSVLRKRRQRLLHVVAEVDRAALLRREVGERMTFAIEEAIRREVVKGLGRQLARAIRVVRILEHLAAEREAVGGRHRIVDVAGLDGDEAIEKLRGAAHAFGPALAGGSVE